MIKKITINIDEGLHDMEIGNVLHGRLGFSSGLVKRLKRTGGGIVLNGKEVWTNKKVCNGDELVITICDKPSENIKPENILLDIIYEDDEVIAVNKPCSMPTHPSHNHYSDTLANGIMYYFKDTDFTFRAITRLDKDTSGVVLVAKNLLAAGFLNEEMLNRRIHKEYAAVVNGVPEPESGTVSVPIKRKENSVMLRCAAPDGKTAITKYCVEKKMGDLSLVRLTPITGRTHQLRVHLSFLGTPIYGDDLYGAPQKDERVRLHCRRVSFCHPVTKEKITVTAPVPEDMTLPV